ncbi:hypothetical protein BC832DRAFT_598115 [Gaertneriomyces semiglobifer]|nr:hypothetical protein BC832DRAFT_598115 [Gaertneriomyces semiglobifer]
MSEAQVRSLIAHAQSSLKRHTCYDLLPVSYKLVVLDTTLGVRKGAAALIQHGVQYAPLWDSATQRYEGMLTVTDIIHLVLHYNSTNTPFTSALEDLDALSIGGLKDIEKTLGVWRERVYAQPSESLWNASRILTQHRLHRLPLLDFTPASPTSAYQETLLSTLTQYKILKYLAANEPSLTSSTIPLSSLIPNAQSSESTSASPKKAPLGRRFGDKLKKATPDMPLLEVLEILVKEGVSSVPVVQRRVSSTSGADDEQWEVIDVFEKYDVLMLAKDPTPQLHNLRMPVSEALAMRSPDHPGIHTCTPSTTLGMIMETIRKGLVRRFVVLDDERGPTGASSQLLGVIGLSDLMRFFVDQEVLDESQ